MKLFLYGSILDTPKLKLLPSDWHGYIFLSNDQRLVAIDESIADKSTNTKLFSKLGLKDVFVLQDSFVDFLKNAEKFKASPMAIKFDTDVEEEYREKIKYYFSNNDYSHAVKLIKEIMEEYECEISAISFFDGNLGTMIEVSNTGVVTVLGCDNISDWFKNAYYFYVLGNYVLPKEARRFIQ